MEAAEEAEEVEAVPGGEGRAREEGVRVGREEEGKDEEEEARVQAEVGLALEAGVREGAGTATVEAGTAAVVAGTAVAVAGSEEQGVLEGGWDTDRPLAGTCRCR